MVLQGNVMPGRLHIAGGFDVDPLQSDLLNWGDGIESNALGSHAASRWL